MSERTEFEEDIIEAIRRVCAYYDAPHEVEQVRAAGILIEHWKRNGLVATAKLICSASDLGKVMRCES